MKFLLPVFLIAFLFFLNRTYAYYYDYIGDHYLKAPGQTVLKEKEGRHGFVVLGDSLMAGVGATSGQSSLGSLLYQSNGKKNELEFLNFAVSGATADDVLKQQLPEALGSRPQVIFLLVGVNDIHNYTPEKEFEENYRLIVNGLTAIPEVKLTLINIPYLGSSSILIPPWNLYIDLKTKQYNSIVSNVAKEKNLKLIDLYKLSREKFLEPSDLYSQDQFHPSDRGYALWADYINAN